MTLGWGASCVDGVVIASDSMRIRWDDSHANVWAELDGEKIDWIGERIAYVRSGSFARAPLVVNVDAGSLDLADVAVQLFAELLDRWIPTPQVDKPLQGVELLIAGGLQGRLPELLLLRSDEPSVDRVPVGATVLAGCMGWGVSQRIQHADKKLRTDAALGLCISACHEYVRALYGSFGGTRLGNFSGSIVDGSGGPIVPVAFPLQVAVITADVVHRYEVGLPDDVTAGDLEDANAEAAAS